MHTDGGNELNWLYPDPKVIVLDDIAKALSKSVRWGNRFDGAITVAKHSLICAMVAKVVAPNDIRFQLDCALHDAAETYLSDIPSTVKHCIYVLDGEDYSPLDEIEETILRTVYTALGVSFEGFNGTRVKNIDIAVRYCEYKVLQRQKSYRRNESFEQINDALTDDVGVSAILVAAKFAEFDIEEAIGLPSSQTEEAEAYNSVVSKLLQTLPR